MRSATFIVISDHITFNLHNQGLPAVGIHLLAKFSSKSSRHYVMSASSWLSLVCPLQDGYLWCVRFKMAISGVSASRWLSLVCPLQVGYLWCVRFKMAISGVSASRWLSLVCPCVGVHRRTSHTSSCLFHKQCPVRLHCLTCIVWFLCLMAYQPSRVI